MHLKLLPLTAAGALLLSAGACRADEWALDRTIGAKLSYNDNLNMQVVNPTSATWYSVSPSLKFSSRTEAHDIRLSMGADINRYLENEDNNATDHNVDLTTKWLGELDQWTLGAASLRNSTLQSETATTGIVTARRQRTQNSLVGAWTRSLGPSTQATLSASSAQVRYEKGPNLIDYDDSSATISAGEAVSDRAVLTASYSYRDFQTVNTPLETQTTASSYSLGGIWQYSERLSFGLNFGRAKTHTDGEVELHYCQGFIFAGYCFGTVETIRIPTHSDSTGTTYSGSANYAFERSSLSASASRGLNASGTGALLRSDMAAINYGYQYNETLSMGLGGSMTQSRDPYSGGKTRFSAVNASLNWRLDQDLVLNLGYTHATQRGADQGESAKVNLLVVGLTWDLPPLSRSK
jgi:hypothetical protein